MNVSEFRNEPYTDFSRPENRSAFEAAFRAVDGQLGRSYPMRIGERLVERRETFVSTNPADPAQVVGRFPRGAKEDAEKAVEAASRAFESWSRTPAEKRADVLFRTAAALRARKHEFSAWMVLEVGKSWPEADGDTAEAIDFCEFYGREMLRLAGPQPITPVAGEQNRLEYLPLGVVAVIPPWNFPCAIMAGMTTAAVVTGNTVVLKPSSDAPTIAERFVDLMVSVGLPPGVVNFVTGSGGVVGSALVEHPKTRMVAFTGSKEAGLDIVLRAARVAPGQIWLKRVIAEMGGKDAIVVAEDADLEAAAQAAFVSAFGYQGQKCSACSRLIVVDKVHDALVEKLVAKVRATKVGPPRDPSNFMGPVINEGARKSILSYIEVGRREGHCAVGGEPGPGPGFFVQPTVFTGIAPKARLSQEEIFGPVLAVIRTRDFDEALKVANDTEYGLTGSVFSSDPRKTERAEREFHVGNLYVNRKCTGALVGGHPFGGFNMSGTDSKAGGRDYLLLFLQAKAISRKV